MAHVGRHLLEITFLTCLAIVIMRSLLFSVNLSLNFHCQYNSIKSKLLSIASCFLIFSFLSPKALSSLSLLVSIDWFSSIQQIYTIYIFINFNKDFICFSVQVLLN